MRRRAGARQLAPAVGARLAFEPSRAEVGCGFEPRPGHYAAHAAGDTMIAAILSLLLSYECHVVERPEYTMRVCTWSVVWSVN